MSGSETNLLDLPDECVLNICEYLDGFSIENFTKGVPIIKDLTESVAKKMTKNMVMVAHNDASINQKRSDIVMTYNERLSMGNNWLSGNYIPRSYRRHYRHKMVLEYDYLYLALDNTVIRIKRNHNAVPGEDAIAGHAEYPYLTASKCKISDFTRKQNSLFEIRSCGEAFIHEDRPHHFKLHSDNQPLVVCDFSKHLYATSSWTATRIWTRDYELEEISLEKKFEFEGSTSLCISDDATCMYTGTKNKLHKFDIETSNRSTHDINNIETTKIQIRDENSIIALSRNCLILHDFRVNLDAAVLLTNGFRLLCFDYDGINGVAVGINVPQCIQLLDIRKPGSSLQNYHVPCDAYGVRGVACDSRYLFGHWNDKIHVLDFKPIV